MHSKPGESRVSSSTKEGELIKLISALIAEAVLQASLDLEPQPQTTTASALNTPSFGMTSGKALSEDLRGILIYMHDTTGLDVKTIASLTGVSRRTVYRVLSTWKRTGEVKPAPEGKQGRPRALDFADTQVNIHSVLNLYGR